MPVSENDMPLPSQRRGYPVRPVPGRDPRLSPPPDVWLYAVRCADYVKIGLAADVQRRIKDFECASPFDVSLVARSRVRADKAGMAERMAHERLADAHHRGEWFRTDPQTAKKAVRYAATAILGMDGPWNEACREYNAMMLRIAEDVELGLI